MTTRRDAQWSAPELIAWTNEVARSRRAYRLCPSWYGGGFMGWAALRVADERGER